MTELLAAGFTRHLPCGSTRRGRKYSWWSLPLPRPGKETRGWRIDYLSFRVRVTAEKVTAAEIHNESLGSPTIARWSWSSSVQAVTIMMIFGDKEKTDVKNYLMVLLS